MSDPAEWVVETRRGDADALHHQPIDLPARRTIVVASVDRPALVLGSAQRDDVVDWHAVEADGLQVTRRRSGGGAVLLEPDGSTWVDVVIPRDDPLWCDDVGMAFHWLGEVWSRALSSLVAPGVPVVHRGGFIPSGWSSLVCFAGLGPGEVTVPTHTDAARGPKLVGMSQRRTRDAARFQCIAHRHWHPGRLVAALALTSSQRAEAASALADAAVELDVPTETIVSALIGHLPT